MDENSVPPKDQSEVTDCGAMLSLLCRYIVHYINVINIVATKREKFIDQACKQLNSIQGATFGLLYHPELIACCMIQRAARLLDIALPEPKHSKLAGRTWIHAVLLAKEAPLLLHGDTVGVRHFSCNSRCRNPLSNHESTREQPATDVRL